MVLGFFSLLQLALCVRALAGSLREGFAIGIAGGFARVMLMLLVAAAMLTSPMSLVPGLHQPALLSGWAASATLIGAIAGPAVSFGVVGVAYARTRNVPMAEEERSRRPLTLWLPVGVLDAMYVAVQVLGVLFGLGER